MQEVLQPSQRLTSPKTQKAGDSQAMPNFLIPSKRGLGALGALFMVAFAPNAFAQAECGDTTCDAGYECVSFQSSCLVIACPEGEKCDFECEPSEQFYCQRAECTDDSECGDHMVCATHERYNCPETDFACDPDGPCEEPEKVECTPEEYSECTPRWELPCEEASDCGEGFACETQEFCSCPGSSGSTGGGSAPSEPVDLLPPPDEGDGDSGGEEDDTTDEAPQRLAPAEPEGRPAPDDSCGCQETDEKYCVVIEQACEEDTDCPQDWSCIDNPAGVCWADTEGNTGCEEADPARVCTPPGQEFGIAEAGIATSGAADTGASSGPAEGEDGRATGGELPPDANPDVDPNGGGEDLAEPGDPDDVDEEPTALPQGSGDNDDVDEAIEDQADDDADIAELDEEDAPTETNGVDLDSSGDSQSSSGGGCSVSSTGAGGDALTMLLIGLGAALSRRRKNA